MTDAMTPDPRPELVRRLRENAARLEAGATPAEYPRGFAQMIQDQRDAASALEAHGASRFDQPIIELPDKHPLRIRAEKAEKERDMLRSALVGLVGVDGKDDLESMEGVMRLMPAPAQDKAMTIDAIHALIATLSEVKL